MRKAISSIGGPDVTAHHFTAACWLLAFPPLAVALYGAMIAIDDLELAAKFFLLLRDAAAAGLISQQEGRLIWGELLECCIRIRTGWLVWGGMAWILIRACPELVDWWQWSESDYAYRYREAEREDREAA